MIDLIVGACVIAMVVGGILTIANNIVKRENSYYGTDDTDFEDIEDDTVYPMPPF